MLLDLTDELRKVEVAGEVEGAANGLVGVPECVDGDGVQTCGARFAQAVAPGDAKMRGWSLSPVMIWGGLPSRRKRSPWIVSSCGCATAATEQWRGERNGESARTSAVETCIAWEFVLRIEGSPKM